MLLCFESILMDSGWRWEGEEGKTERERDKQTDRQADRQTKNSYTDVSGMQVKKGEQCTNE